MRVAPGMTKQYGLVCKGEVSVFARSRWDRQVLGSRVLGAVGLGVAALPAAAGNAIRMEGLRS
jgi:hypothetical protein